MPRGRLKLTKEDKEWALNVKKRDEFKCIICGSTEFLNSHHLLPRERKDTKLDITNGVTLCVSHHMFSRIISAHNHPIAFAMWLQENRPEQWEYVTKKCKELL